MPFLGSYNLLLDLDLSSQCGILDTKFKSTVLVTFPLPWRDRTVWQPMKGFQKVRVSGHYGRVRGSREAGMVLEQNLRAYILSWKLEAESQRLGVAWAFKAPKPTPSDIPPLLVLPNTVMQALDQASKYMNQRGAILIQTTTHISTPRAMPYVLGPFLPHLAWSDFLREKGDYGLIWYCYLLVLSNTELRMS